jgi:hypothetical protein
MNRDAEPLLEEKPYLFEDKQPSGKFPSEEIIYFSVKIN